MIGTLHRDGRPAGPRFVGDVWLTNRDDLVRTLDVRGSDAELVVAAYDRWGERCIEHLDGELAFVIRDERDGSLFCARDPFGTRPFFYALSAEHLSFASDVVDVDAPRTPDLDVIKSTLVNPHFVDDHRTLYREVRKLAPGHTMRVTASDVTTRRYWNPAEITEARSARFGDRVAELRALLEDAVATRMTDGTGAHLSGGLDSSAVAIIAARRRERPLDVFSWSPPPDGALKADDERHKVARIVAAERMRCHYLTYRADDYRAQCEWALPRGMLFNHHAAEAVVCRSARDAGISTLLSGWGGDEAVSIASKGYYAGLLVERRVPALARAIWVKARTERVPLVSFGRWLWTRALRPVLPVTTRAEYPAFVSAQMRERLRHAHVIERPPYREVPGVHSNQRRLLLHGHLAERMETWAAIGAAHGIVHRYPLLDRRIVELALGTPAEMFVQGGEHRALFTAASRGLHDCFENAKHEPASLAAQVRVGDGARNAWIREQLRRPGPVIDRAAVTGISRALIQAIQAEYVLERAHG